MYTKVKPTYKERFFGENEIIVSKTDINGKITYVNHVFLDIAGYTEIEVMGMPHSMIRHPDMPRCVFKLLWETIQTGSEIFAYVMNMAKEGDHYWVFAHVTPTFDSNGQIIGFHSNRRVPNRESVETMQSFYKLLRAEEERHPDPRQGLESSYRMLQQTMADKGVAYEEFIFSV